MKMICIVFAIMTRVSFASAVEQIGEIDCYTLDRPVSYVVHAKMFGRKSAEGWFSEYVNITLTSYNWDTTKETKPLKAWRKVPNMKDRHFSEHYKNEKVEFEAFYDDVGAMSSIWFEGKEHQLVCNFN